MAAPALVEVKLNASKRLVDELIAKGSSLLAAYWDFDEDVDRWTLQLVPRSSDDQRSLIHEATELLVEKPYRSVFSVIDPSVDSHQIGRARALGAYIRTAPYFGQVFDKTITGGEYFQSVVPVFFAPELLTHLRPAA